ncbi:MAG: hypothetical protein AAGU27_10540 [Dehalobacterium sp.]
MEQTTFSGLVFLTYSSSLPKSILLSVAPHLRHGSFVDITAAERQLGILPLACAFRTFIPYYLYLFVFSCSPESQHLLL